MIRDNLFELASGDVLGARPKRGPWSGINSLHTLSACARRVALGDGFLSPKGTHMNDRCKAGKAALLGGLGFASMLAFSQQPVAPAPASTEMLVRALEAASTKPLPDADSADAKLVSAYCSQCHGTPQPVLHTDKEWVGVAQRMYEVMKVWPGVKAPSEQQIKTILSYMQKHARQ